MNKSFLLGAIFGGVVAVGAYILTKEEKQYSAIKFDEDGNMIEDEEPDEEKKSVEEKIKEGLKKENIKANVEKGINWLVERKDQLEMASIVIGLLTAGANLRNTIKEGQMKQQAQRLNWFDYIKKNGAKKTMLISDQDDGAFVCEYLKGVA